MIDYEYFKLKAWREILGHIKDEYGANRSLGNVLQNINARVKFNEERMKNERATIHNKSSKNS